MPEVILQDVAGGGRICFRGDARLPAEIFASGFVSRAPDKAPSVSGPGRYWMPVKAAHAAAYANRGKTVVDGKYDPSTMTNPPATPVAVVETANRNAQGGLVGIVNQKYAALFKAPDFLQETAVCVTPRFAMAALFPPKAGKFDAVADVTWIYVVFVRQLYNTHARQVVDGMRAIRQEMSLRVAVNQDPGDEQPYGGREVLDLWARDGALWPLYAQELATKSIDAGDVIGAIRCRRTWKGDNWTYGASYNLDKDTVQWHKRCVVDANYVDAARTFITAEPESGDTPDRASGFQRSEWR